MLYHILVHFLWPELNEEGKTYQTTRGTSAAIDSSILLAATEGLCRSVNTINPTLCRQLRFYIRDEDGGSGSTGLLDCLCDARKDGFTEMSLSGLLWVGTTDNIGSYMGINTIILPSCLAFQSVSLP